MKAIADSAGVSKRSLYLWHADKAALFHACVLDGAERFPLPTLDTLQAPERALSTYAADIVRSLSNGERYAMSLLLMREGRDLPELTAPIGEIEFRYMVGPLAEYLACHGVPADDVTRRAQLFLAMALSEFNHCMLLGMPPPDDRANRQHAHLVVEVFLHGQSMAHGVRKRATAAVHGRVRRTTTTD